MPYDPLTSNDPAMRVRPWSADEELMVEMEMRAVLQLRRLVEKVMDERPQLVETGH